MFNYLPDLLPIKIKKMFKICFKNWSACVGEPDPADRREQQSDVEAP